MTVKKFALAALGATFLVSAALPSLAAPGRHGPGRGGDHAMMQDMLFIRLLKSADTNKDGKISKDELVAWEEATFTAIDANKDGILTPGEIRKYREARMDEWRERRKAERAENADEPKGPPVAQGDNPPPPPPPGPDAGPRGKHGHRDMADGDRGPGRHHPGREGMGPRGMMPGAALIRMIDTDEDGQISKAEARAAVDKLFERMDRNKDGFITVDDLPDRPL